MKETPEEMLRRLLEYPLERVVRNADMLKAFRVLYGEHGDALWKERRESGKAVAWKANMSSQTDRESVCHPGNPARLLGDFWRCSVCGEPTEEDKHCTRCGHPSSYHIVKYASDEPGESLYACGLRECGCHSCETAASPQCEVPGCDDSVMPKSPYCAEHRKEAARRLLLEKPE